MVGENLNQVVGNLEPWNAAHWRVDHVGAIWRSREVPARHPFERHEHKLGIVLAPDRDRREADANGPVLRRERANPVRYWSFVPLELRRPGAGRREGFRKSRPEHIRHGLPSFDDGRRRGNLPARRDPRKRAEEHQRQHDGHQDDRCPCAVESTRPPGRQDRSAYPGARVTAQARRGVCQAVVAVRSEASSAAQECRSAAVTHARRCGSRLSGEGRWGCRVGLTCATGIAEAGTACQRGTAGNALHGSTPPLTVARVLNGDRNSASFAGTMPGSSTATCGSCRVARRRRERRREKA